MLADLSTARFGPSFSCDDLRFEYRGVTGALGSSFSLLFVLVLCGQFGVSLIGSHSGRRGAVQTHLICKTS